MLPKQADMRCDECYKEISENSGYAFYSDVAIVEGVQVGNMLICEACTQRIVSQQSFVAPRKYRDSFAFLGNPDSNRDLLTEL